MPAGISALAPAVASFEAASVSDASGRRDGLGVAKAFTILQKDGLDTTLPLLHHANGDDSGSEAEDDEDEDDSAASKLTTIRRSLRNDSSVFAPQPQLRQLSRSSDQLGPSAAAPVAAAAKASTGRGALLRGRDFSRSQGNLPRDEHRLPHCCKAMHLSTEDFNEALSAKLRKIQEAEAEEQRRQAARLSQVQHPKPFITTVKSGEFLMPPPEVAVLLGIGSGAGGGEELDGSWCRSRFRQQLASLNRRPEVRHQMHQARCRGALKATEDFGGSVSCVSGLSGAGRSKRDLHHTEHPPSFGNLMFDRRVMPGGSFAAAPHIVDCERSKAAKQAETQKRQATRKRAQIQAALMRIGTPPPVTGRKHEPVQTELFLEELFEKPDESEVAVQTDYFLDRPITPPYCPPKRGQDASTQIEPGDLFDYDVEVQPILEVLVGKTIEQALIEVLEEEEIALLREQQRKFLEVRAVEKAEQQRLEEQDRRIREEKDRRVKQHEEAVKAQRETEERVAAAVLLTGYIAELLPAVLENLKISGVLLDEIKADVEEDFMPWLMKEVKKEVGTMIDSRAILEDIIKEIIKNRAKTYKQLGEEYDALRKSGMDHFEDACGEEEFVDDDISMNDYKSDIDNGQKNENIVL